MNENGKIKIKLAQQKGKEPYEVNLSHESVFIQVVFYNYGTILRFPGLSDNLAVGHLTAYYDDYHDNDGYCDKFVNLSVGT